MPGNSTVGILLAAGKGVRFDPDGHKNKLLQLLGSGEFVAQQTVRNLFAAVDTVLAVVRKPDSELARVLKLAGCTLVPCPQSDQGMGASLVCGVRAAPENSNFLIALADMPYVQPATLRVLTDAVQGGAGIAVPVHAGRRGNPVAFGAGHREHLLQLGGDEGARRLLRQYPVLEIDVSDAGIHRDIDRPADLSDGA